MAKEENLVADAAEKRGAGPVVPTQLRAETMAYAVQSGIYNLAANFFEPYIGYRTQKYYSGYDRAHPGAYGNYTQNLAGEFAGDVIGSSTLILGEAFFPQQLHAFTRTARGWVDPLYSSVAHKVFADEEGQPGYEEKIERWKTFQERNLVRSGIMGAAGIAGNVLTQKALIGNPSPAGVIFRGKLLSTALTTALGLGSRFAFPTPMRRMDSWLGKNIFAPMMEDAAADAPPASYAEKLHPRNPERAPEI